MAAPAYLTPGDLLKAEADYHQRVGITATKGTKVGQLVVYPGRNQYLVALTDESYGQVMVQPQNCTINLDNVAQADIDALKTLNPADGTPTSTKLTVAQLIKEGDAFGIKYVGTPYLAV